MAFIDLGDQFIALQKGRSQPSDSGRHFGLVVDDKDAVRSAMAEAGVEALPGPFLDFRDPWNIARTGRSLRHAAIIRRRRTCRSAGRASAPEPDLVKPGR